MTQTIDFGAPPEFGRHCFYVEIPANASEAVSLYEDYGFDGDESRRETTECRVILARKLWNKIRDDARKNFNIRLKAKKLKPSSWKIGINKLDRFLGREICILAWASEHATIEECPIICQKWLALRPEERWWFYSKAASEAGLAEQTQRGWRKSLYCALSDGESIKLNHPIKPKTKQKVSDEGTSSSLFDFIEQGEI